jgi:hypothetical protein
MRQPPPTFFVPVKTDEEAEEAYISLANEPG